MKRNAHPEPLQIIPHAPIGFFRRVRGMYRRPELSKNGTTYIIVKTM